MPTHNSYTHTHDTCILTHSHRSSLTLLQWALYSNPVYTDHLMSCITLLDCCMEDTANLCKEAYIYSSPPSMHVSFRLDPCFIHILALEFIHVFTLACIFKIQQYVSAQGICLGHCYSCGRPGWCCWLLDSAWSKLGCQDYLKSKLENGKLCLCVSFYVTLPFK